MRLFKRGKKYKTAPKELDEYSTSIFHFIYEHQRLPTNQEMFLKLKIPSAALEEVIHYFNHPPQPIPLKKYDQEQLRQLDAQSILIFPFIQTGQLNLTEIVIGLNYSTSNARELVNFCNSVIKIPENKVMGNVNLYNTQDTELNVVRVVKTYQQLKKASKPTELVSILDLARESRLGVLTTRVALSYYEHNRLNIPLSSDLSESRVKELDAEIRRYFSDLLKAPSLTLESILTHPNWKLPISDPPELTIENVTKITDKFIREYKPRAEDPVTGIFQLAGDTMKNIVNTFISPAIEKAMEDSIRNPTLKHAQELLSVLQPIRDQEVELAPTYNVGLQTIEYVPAEQVMILKEKDRFYCGLCQNFYPKKDSHYECSSCQRSVCLTCYKESLQAGLTKCPVCRGALKMTIKT